MTSLPGQTEKKLGLAIDLDTCVGCHACVISCKEWNTSNYGVPLSDVEPYGANPVGSFLNRVHTFEAKSEERPAQIIHFPKSCCTVRMHHVSRFVPLELATREQKMG